MLDTFTRPLPLSSRVPRWPLPVQVPLIHHTALSLILIVPGSMPPDQHQLASLGWNLLLAALHPQLSIFPS